MKKRMFYEAPSLIFHKAKELRNQVTHAEMVLWNYLRNNQLGYRFRRQHPIGNFIVDFYCHKLNLAIEIDGPIHDDEEIKIAVAERQKILEAEGITVVRFTNNQVLKNIDDVIKTIKMFAIEKL